MCFCFLWCFGHRCRQYTDELNILWPHFERHYTVAGFIQQFLYRLKQAQIIAAPSLGSGSVSYCRTRGPSAYPFLLVELRVVDAGLYHQPVMLKFQGFDGPPPMREPDYVWYPFDTPQEDTTLSLAYIGESARQFVGTRRYDVCHTMGCRGNIVDLLVLATLALERDHTRAVFPATLFLALQSVCKGTVTSSTKRRAREAPLPSEIAEEEKNAVVDAFPARRQQMLEDMNRPYKYIQFM